MSRTYEFTSSKYNNNNNNILSSCILVSTHAMDKLQYIESPITIIMMIHVMYMGKGWGLDLNPVPTHTKGV